MEQKRRTELTEGEKREVVHHFSAVVLDQAQGRHKWISDKALELGVTPLKIREALRGVRRPHEIDPTQEITQWRDELRDTVASLLESTERELLDEDAGEYGYGGEWFSHPEVNKHELVEFVLDVMEFMRSVR